ncbi:tetratricopeptide repeat protein [Meridianimarinicoccus aquatilis]|uniref:Tetratricopeptide repeat protein n=1 Tax=Meridianimarinicoccus aquatilis TaxID=2552766 RepID=A0A4R6AZ10_9RHOB|nr:tetratricopeptide repeat protein [Fluviibacterium aquatile]TDL89004.1 tetratricopeptide repeat protein [Fluviibacterium aquatile]
MLASNGFVRSTALACAISTFFVLQSSPVVSATFSAEVGEEFLGEQFEWLTSPTILSLSGAPKDPAALFKIASLVNQDDEQAGLALQNYLKRYPNDPAAYDLAGAALLQDGDAAGALLAFRKGVSLAPENDWLRAKYGASLVLAGDARTGRKELEKVVAQSPDNPIALRQLAQLERAEGDIAKAIILSERTLRVFGLPYGAVNQAHFDLSDLYTQIGRHRDVLDLLGPAVRNPDLDLPSQSKIELFGRFLDAAIVMGDPITAREALDTLESLIDPEHPSFRLTDARILRLSGDLDGAQAGLESLMKDHPEMGSALRPDLAIVLAAKGDITAAALIWETIAEEQHQGDDITFFRRAFSTLVEGNQSEVAMEKAAALTTRYPEREDVALLELDILSNAGGAQAAFEKASEAIVRFPQSAAILQQHGVLASALGDKTTAESSLRKALRIDPEQPKTWLTLSGVIHGHSSYVGDEHAGGSHADVEMLLLEALVSNPSSADLNSELGLMYLSDGRVAKAISAFDRAVKNNPVHMAGLSLGALARADIAEDLGTALAFADRATAMAPHEAINQDILGWVLVRQGAYEAGMKLLKGAAEAEPDDVTIQYHLGVAYAEQDMPDQAREHLLAALAGPNYSHNVDHARMLYTELTPAETVVADVSSLADGTSYGSVSFHQTAEGVRVTADLLGLPPGHYAAHVHEYATCLPGEDGQPGGAAGAHYGSDGHDGHMSGGTDHMGHGGGAMTGSSDSMASTGVSMAGAADHSATMTMGSETMGSDIPAGDLPDIMVDANGASTASFIQTTFTLAEIRGRSLMLHESAELGGGKFACAIVP